MSATDCILVGMGALWGALMSIRIVLTDIRELLRKQAPK